MKPIACIISASLRLGGSKAPLLTRGARWQRLSLTGWFSLTILVLASGAFAQVPAPKDTLGFTPVDDRKLASWAQVVDYFQKLDRSSDRMTFQEIGKTTMGAPFVYATISSPANLRQIKKYEDINAKLADPRKIGGTRTLLSARDAVAKQLIAQGKTIVLITCGIHSTEVGSTLSSMLIAHKLTSSNDAEIKKILDNTIILLVPSLNPDGVDIVKNWYDRMLGTPHEGTSPPELYHKYVGHDNNRDWYAFTQVETQLTVDKIHNVWHPQIVHDIHQQGENGSRLFLPPYMQPVEPNVPKQIVEGYTELGNYMAADLRAKGFQGITTNSTYDAWTPARAYSHYHGGVRILSETASAKIATPVTKKFEDLRVPADDGYDPKKESANFGPLWLGGEWKLRNITDYMTTAAFSLLNHAADNREKWLSRFYEIGKEAVRPRRSGELYGYRVRIGDNFPVLVKIFERAGIQYGYPKGEKETSVGDMLSSAETKYPAESVIIPLQQPYGAFAKALLESQTYPDLKDEHGSPIPPYDVTAHTLPFLMNADVSAINAPFNPAWLKRIYIERSVSHCVRDSKKLALYRSFNPSMDEGWTRWIRDDDRDACDNFENILSTDIAKNNFVEKSSPGRAYLNKRPISAIIFPDQPANQILNGYAKGAMPDEYTGGVGKEGVENLKKFVAGGGTLVFLNRASNFAIEQFNLPIKDVTQGVGRKDFYIPGSILRTELDLTHPIAKGMPEQSIAWFENSPAFEIETRDGRQETGEKTQSPVSRLSSPVSGIRVIATYPKNSKDILLSGWALGAEKIAGKAALVEVTMGKGKIVLFGFRPQYRGQSLATFQLLFNAISH